MKLPRRKLLALSLGLIALGSAARAGDFVYLFSRGAAPSLRSFELEADGTLTPLPTITYSAQTADTSNVERKVLGYAKREKLLVVGRVKGIDTLKVAADGTLSATPGASATFPGTRVDSIEVVERGAKTFIYAADEINDHVYGYELGAAGELTALPGFPFETPDGVRDMASAGAFLYTAQWNLFVHPYAIGTDGSLSNPGFSGSRPESDVTQVEPSPDGSTIYANADDTSYVQIFQRNKKEGNLIFGGLAPFRATYTSPTLIGIGKKHLVVARVESDVQPDIRILKMEKKGRLKPIKDNYTGDSGMTDLRSIALVRSDTIVLAVSDVSKQLRSLHVNMEYGMTDSTPLDIVGIPGLSNLSTMLVVTR